MNKFIFHSHHLGRVGGRQFRIWHLFIEHLSKQNRHQTLWFRWLIVNAAAISIIEMQCCFLLWFGIEFRALSIRRSHALFACIVSAKFSLWFVQFQISYLIGDINLRLSVQKVLERNKNFATFHLYDVIKRVTCPQPTTLKDFCDPRSRSMTHFYSFGPSGKY